MKTILAIDTSSEACSASLLYNNECCTKFEIAPQAHSQLVLQMCERLLIEAQIKLADLDALAFCRGPGSFTGLRIGAGVIQGLAYSQDLPVIKISSLEALAQNAARSTKNIHVLSIIDARMNEIYWAQYFIDDNAKVISMGDEQLGVVENLPNSMQEPLVGVGSGWEIYENRLNKHLKSTRFAHNAASQYISAEDIVTLAAIRYEKGEWVEPGEALPVYLRNNVVHKR